MSPSDVLATSAFQRLRVVAGVLTVAFAASSVLPAASHAVDDEEAFFQLGIAVGRSLTDFQLTGKELKTVQKGINAVIDGKTVDEPTEEVMKKLAEIRNERVAKATTEYLAASTAEKGAEVQESGLIYFEIEEGSGATPAPTDTVTVHYHGTLSNGAVFDSSRTRGEPTEFPLNRVIACWTEGVGKMKTGGKAKLVCPPEIAYGDRGAPPTIPGGAVLTFEVELIEIKPADPTPAAE
jgi:FKBP-type peptidyl-prolyl cis-trans isomerase FkpA